MNRATDEAISRLAGETVVPCVMPRPSTAWAGAAALWVTAAGWSAAARSRFGEAFVLTPDAATDPEGALTFAEGGPTTAKSPSSSLRTTVTTAAKDVLLYRDARQFVRAIADSRWEEMKIPIVWHHHDLFHRAGLALARRVAAPAVVFVHAPQVWEARRWGVARPGWGGLIERFDETATFRAADVVACVTEEVADAVIRLGAPSSRVVVTPMSVDAARFNGDVSGAEIRRRHQLEGHVVIGWAGSFRRFHGLDAALTAFRDVHNQTADVRLLLVGDGPDRGRLQALTRDYGMQDVVVFTGHVPPRDVPTYLAAMDIAVVTAGNESEFHYSPLKLREFMAMGVPVVAPLAGEIGRFVEDGVSGLLYENRDASGFARLLLDLCGDDDKRRRIGDAGRERVLATSTWHRQLDRVLATLGIR